MLAPGHVSRLYDCLGRVVVWYPFEQGRCQFGGSRVCHVVPAVSGLYAADRAVESTAQNTWRMTSDLHCNLIRMLR